MSNKVVFVTQEDPFYVREFFEELLDHWGDAGNIATIVIAPPMGKRSLARLARQMYGLYGPVDFVRLGTRFAWFKLARRLSDLFGWKSSYSVAQACLKRGQRVERVDSLNAPEFLAKLKGLEPDLVISVAAPQVFGQPLIDSARLGCFNIHNSLLPKYRGMLPNFWQLYHGEKTVGTTVHRINAALDDGEILLQQRVEVVPGESLESLIRRTKRLGAHLMIDAVRRAFKGSLSPLPNDRSNASYFGFPVRADAREFRRRGNKLL